MSFLGSNWDFEALDRGSVHEICILEMRVQEILRVEMDAWGEVLGWSSQVEPCDSVDGWVCKASFEDSR